MDRLGLATHRRCVRGRMHLRCVANRFIKHVEPAGERPLGNARRRLVVGHSRDRVDHSSPLATLLLAPTASRTFFTSDSSVLTLSFGSGVGLLRPLAASRSSLARFSTST